MTDAHFATSSWKYVFNTPLEVGVRCAALLFADRPNSRDLTRIVQYEYLLVHSGDVEDGPASLHPATPHRAGELLVRRGLVENGLLFMLARNIVCRILGETGISYGTGEYSRPFFDALAAPYTLSLLERATWVVKKFGALPDDELSGFMRDHWSDWGSEFSREAFVRGKQE